MADQRPRSRDGLFKRGGSPYWQCWIRGQRQSTKCRDREAARLVKAKLERAAADPAYLAAHQATVGGAVVDFLEQYKTRDRSALTAKMYRVKCGHLVRILGENLRLADLGARNVDAYIKQRLEVEGASRMTVGKELTALRQVLRVAQRLDAFPFEIGKVMPIGFDTNYEPKTRALTWEELGKLVPEVARFSKPHAAMVVFFVAAAARKSEAERAHGEDIDWASWTVRIRGTKTRRSADDVPIAPPFRDLFAALVPRTTGLLWGVWTNMTRDLAAACQRCGIPKVTANDLRRSNATLLRVGGAGIDLVARMLRHTNSKMVEQVYGRIGAKDAGRLLAAQLEAATPSPKIGEHCHYQHNVGGPPLLSPCVRGQNRTADTRIFKPVAVVTDSPGDRGFLLDPASAGSDESALTPGFAATNSTRWTARASVASWSSPPPSAGDRRATARRDPFLGEGAWR